MKLAIAALCLGLFSAAAYAQDIKGISGWIEDDMVKVPGTPSSTVKTNLNNGAHYVFVDDKSKNVWRIDNPDTVKGHEGHHVSVAGSMDKTGMSVHIVTLSMMKDQTPGPGPEAVGR